MIPVWLQIALGLSLYLQLAYMFYLNELRHPEHERVTDLVTFRILAAVWPVVVFGIWIAAGVRVLARVLYLISITLLRLEQRFQTP